MASKPLPSTDDPTTKRLSGIDARHFTFTMRSLEDDEIQRRIDAFHLMDHHPDQWDHELHKQELLQDILNKRHKTAILAPYEYKMVRLKRAT